MSKILDLNDVKREPRSEHIANSIATIEIENFSDGYHTFKELYEFRMLYNAMLFDCMYNAKGNEYNVHKSWKHHDGEWCFGKEKEWFIVVAELPTGTISNHYSKENWNLFLIPEVEKSTTEYDGHTAKDVASRIRRFLQGEW